MSVQWWYGAATTSLAWAVYLLLGQSTDLVALLSTHGLGLGLRGLLFILWFMLPVFIALDLRQIRNDITWDPAVGPWVLISVIWLANVAAGIAYCVRRESALRYTVPSGKWVYGVIAGLVFWCSLVFVNFLSTVVSTGMVGTVLSGPLVLVALVGYPMSLYLDIEHVRGYTHWNPSMRFWLVGITIPLVNIFVGSVYLIRRHAEFKETSDPNVVELLDVEAQPIPPVPSPWYHRITLITTIYFLLFIVFGGTPELPSINLWQLTVFLWIPFGIVLVPMIYFDLDELRDYGLEWGPTRYLYLTSVLFLPVAFLYLLRRSTMGRRALAQHHSLSDHPDGD